MLLLWSRAACETEADTPRAVMHHHSLRTLSDCMLCVGFAQQRPNGAPRFAEATPGARPNRGTAKATP